MVGRGAVGSRIAGDRHQLGDLGLVRVAHHPLDARQAGQLLRRALGIAAGDQNARGGIFAMHAADGLAHVFVGGAGDGAGVEHHEIGRGALAGGFQPLSREQRFQRRTIGLRRHGIRNSGRSTSPLLYYEAFRKEAARCARSSGQESRASLAGRRIACPTVSFLAQEKRGFPFSFRLRLQMPARASSRWIIDILGGELWKLPPAISSLRLGAWPQARAAGETGDSPPGRTLGSRRRILDRIPARSSPGIHH